MTGYVSPAMPTADEWESFGISNPVELHAGKQSRVFAATADNRAVAIKLTDRHLADADLLHARTEIVERLADDVPEIVGPLRLRNDLVEAIDAWWMTATPFVVGESLELEDPTAGDLMGRTLARIHVTMANMSVQNLPVAAALRGAPVEHDRSDWQLLHGDFSDQNMRLTPSGLRVFDLDDCVLGPVEYDVANSLYMVLFDAEVEGRSQRYDTFRAAFVAGYESASEITLESELLDDFIAMRIRVLGSWLDDLPNAPIGIRTSSADWLTTLRTFVQSHE